jgi:hypothetical protein
MCLYAQKYNLRFVDKTLKINILKLKNAFYTEGSPSTNFS